MDTLPSTNSNMMFSANFPTQIENILDIVVSQIEHKFLSNHECQQNIFPCLLALNVYANEKRRELHLLQLFASVKLPNLIIGEALKQQHDSLHRKNIMFIVSYRLKGLYVEMPKMTKCPSMTNCPKSKCPNNIQPKNDKMPRVIKRPKDIMPMMTICPNSHFA